MNTKKILLITLIAVAILASVSAVSAGMFDGLFGGQQQDNVIEIDNITFNTTNTTNFTNFEKYDNSSDGVYESKFYGNIEDGKQGKYTVGITQFYNKDVAQESITKLKEQYKDSKSVIDGREVYLTSAVVGDYVGEPRYSTYVYNADLNKIVSIATPDANETVKMASTLKFK